MKKIFLASILLLSFTSLFSQKGKYERIKALKIAYITDKVNLSSKEAEIFWPVYNQFDNELYQLKVVTKRSIMRKMRLAGGIEQLSDLEAKKIVESINELNNSIFAKEQEKFYALKKILSAKKLLKLYRAEETFKRQLLQKLRQKKGTK